MYITALCCPPGFQCAGRGQLGYTIQQLKHPLTSPHGLQTQHTALKAPKGLKYHDLSASSARVLKLCGSPCSKALTGKTKLANLSFVIKTSYKLLDNKTEFGPVMNKKRSPTGPTAFLLQSWQYRQHDSAKANQQNVWKYKYTI
jgi:hypothetical protein